MRVADADIAGELCAGNFRQVERRVEAHARTERDGRGFTGGNAASEPVWFKIGWDFKSPASVAQMGRIGAATANARWDNTLGGRKSFSSGKKIRADA